MSVPLIARPAAIPANTARPLALSPSTTTQKSHTTGSPPSVPLVTKVWEIPPRPKPGRKPSLDTPPTKRKQQNRAAQRAFRERRVARVDELEEEKKSDHKEWEKERARLQAQLEQERKFYQHNVTEWRMRAEHWQKMAHDQERLRLEREDEIRFLRRRDEAPRMEAGNRTTAPPVEAVWDRSSRMLPALPSTTHETAVACSRCGQEARCNCFDRSKKVLDERSGDCTGDGRCDCAKHIYHTDESIGGQNQGEPLNIKQEDADEMEIDFTARFAKRNHASLEDSVVIIDQNTPSYASPIATELECGFCTDDSNCVCKASASQGAAFPSVPSQSQLRPPTLISPPSSVAGDPPQRPQPAEPIAGPKGPGTCSACMDDPQRRQFCMSMAAAMPPPPLAAQPTISSAAIGDTRFGSIDAIACSAAYDRLSQNPSFPQHKTDIDFLRHIRPALRAYDDVGITSSRYPVEVNSSSVLEAAQALDGMRRSWPAASTRRPTEQTP